MTKQVKGYIFESFTRKRAQQFNFLLQMWDDEFVLVNKSTYVLVEGVCGGDVMRALCILIDEPYKELVTIEADEVEEIKFNSMI